MAQNEPLAPKPNVPGGYFWTIWADWDMVVKVGFGFVGAIVLFALIQFHFEDKNQRESFKVALTTIPADFLANPIGQRQARLLKSKGVYSWRGILWLKKNGTMQPKIWHAEIQKEKQTFRCINSTIMDYEQSKAWDLELFDDISRSPQAAP